MQFLSLRDAGSPLVPYAKAWEFQKSLVERRVRDEIPDTFLFVEHPPTVTRGRGLQRSSMDETVKLRAMPLGPLSPGTEYFEIERGGDLTWHGPGQLVIYPIVKLDGKGFGPDHDVTGFLRKLEKSVGTWLSGYGLEAVSRENAAGIWVVRPEGSERKIASIGIAVRKWVTYHGIGVNVSNSLTGYREFSPCGFSPEVMTTLSELRPDSRIDLADRDARGKLEEEIARAISGDANSRIEEVDLT